MKKFCDDHEWVGTGDCPACEQAFAVLSTPRQSPTHPANTPERDAAIRELAGRFSQVAAGQPLDISVAAAALFIVAQADHANCTSFNAYVAKQLRRVANLYPPA